MLISGLTTIAGFGSLALGKHQGLQSLGYVMATGLATCMVAALVLLPALLNLIYGGPKLARSAAAQEASRRDVPADDASGETEVKPSYAPEA